MTAVDETLARLRDALAGERERSAAWRALAEARALLLVHYRTGSRPSEALLKRLDKAKADVKRVDPEGAPS
jgi:hypothetical protein